MDSWARTGMLSDNGVMAAQSAAFIGRVTAVNPRAWDYQDDPAMNAFMSSTNRYLEANMAPQEAASMAHKLIYEMPDSKRRALQDQYNAHGGKYPKGNGPFLNQSVTDDPRFTTPESGLMGKWFGATDPVPVPTQMMAEFNGLVGDYYVLNNGDIKAAREDALDHVASTWGVTRMNGSPELVRTPPELTYTNLTPEGIIAHKNDMLGQMGYAGDPAGVRIVEFPFETARTEGKVWGLIDDNGAVLNPRNNVPVQFEMPITEDQRGAAAAELEKAKLKEARAQQRELRRQLEIGNPTFNPIPGMLTPSL
jgi:hypothetical protein